LGRTLWECRERDEEQEPQPHFESSGLRGGTGEKYPTTSISTPTAMNDTMRPIPVTRERSTRKSFTTTTAMSTAPVIQSTRLAVRVAKTMVASASTDQKIESADCATTERRMPSNVYGTSAQWCTLR